MVQEVERTWRNRIDIDDIVGRIRQAVVAEHEIVPHEIALLRPGALPTTTSGKIQRALEPQAVARRDRLTGCNRRTEQNPRRDASPSAASPTSRIVALVLAALLPAACAGPLAPPPANPFAGAWNTAERQQIAFRDDTGRDEPARRAADSARAPPFARAGSASVTTGKAARRCWR